MRVVGPASNPRQESSATRAPAYHHARAKGWFVNRNEI